jgi:cytochrome c-type biogenesis protein CcmH/NrfG
LFPRRRRKPRGAKLCRKVSLSSEPNKPDTLFNLGVVKWQGKKDAPGAIAAWQKLLDTNPGYENKEKVLQLIAQAKGH